jgi:hypothetical protein
MRLIRSVFRLAVPAVALMTLLGPHVASARGFAVQDLAPFGPSLEKALGPGFAHRAQARRVTLMCPTCEGSPMVDVLLGRQADGTEARLRSGETPIARLEALCRARSSSCRLAALVVSPAVGWVLTYGMGSQFGSTAVVLRDGDLLTIRVIAGSEALARASVDKVVAAAAGAIIRSRPG